VKRRWKILIGVVVVLAVLLAVNAVVIDNQTKGSEVTIEGGEILELPGGDVQVFEQGPTHAEPPTAPIVLLHCYSCSLHWWDKLAPILAEDHRVVRIDLLGHGGSAKPKADYSIEEQSALVATALRRLNVEGAVVVGHSLGGTIAAALASRATELVSRLVIIDQAPDNSYGPGLGLIADLAYVPVLGEAMHRFAQGFPGSAGLIKSGYSDAFAPGFEIESGFENPDQVVEDLRAMTYTSFDRSPGEEDDYTEEVPLNERMADTPVPLMVIFGTEDQIYDAAESLAAYDEAVPGVITEEVSEAGHSPNVEQPEETAALILDFAAEALVVQESEPDAPEEADTPGDADTPDESGAEANPPAGPPREQTGPPADRAGQQSGPGASESGR
jgi:pimeloyl-ACP methyl ester carboxylesterase